MVSSKTNFDIYETLLISCRFGCRNVKGYQCEVLVYGVGRVSRADGVDVNSIHVFAV